MSTEENKGIVAAYLGHFGRSDIQAVLADMTDDATWWVVGRPELFRGAGTRTKAEMADAWRDLYAVLNGGLAMNVVTMTAEGDRVSAEVRSDAHTKGGKDYQNDYHMLFTVRDGKIAAVREYTDLIYAMSVLG